MTAGGRRIKNGVLKSSPLAHSCLPLLKHGLNAGMISLNSGLRILKIKEIKHRKTSDTLFVLGSGPSICKYTEKMWKKISEHDSAGFNKWILHDYAPAFYSMESASVLFRKETVDAFFHNLAEKAADYSGVTMIFKYSNHMRRYIGKIPENIRNAYISVGILIPGEGKTGLKKYTELFGKLGIFDSGSLFPTRNSSVDWWTGFAVKMGYENIVLCGVDLNNSDYFFEKERHRVGKNLIIPASAQRGAVHKTNDPAQCFGGVPVEEVLLTLHEAVLKPRGMNIYIGSPESALRGSFPLYDWN